jgi:hypothetical protein
MPFSNLTAMTFGNGELLLLAENGTHSAQNISNARRGQEAKADVFDYIERFYNVNAGTPQSAI